jgi:hypothetical protein
MISKGKIKLLEEKVNQVIVKRERHEEYTSRLFNGEMSPNDKPYEIKGDMFISEFALKRILGE